jgi:mannose-6-phosphate isomerase-like protein (cupin superfamily)
MGMEYKLTKSADIPRIEKFGVSLEINPDVGGAGIVLVSTETGHNQEFYHRQSTFTYIVLDGSGEFFLNDEAVEVMKGDVLSIPPNTRIYFKGKLQMILITTPAWNPQNEVQTKSSIW